MQRSRGFTLIEMVISMAVTTIIMLACASVMVLAARAAQNGMGSGSQVGRVLQAKQAADMIVADVETATTIREQTLTAVTLVVPDRDGDGSPETIRYAWGGVVGDDLTRTYNGTTSVLAANVSRFSLDHVLRVAAAGSPVSNTLRVISANIADTGILLSQYSVTSSNWIAERFTPTLPKGTSSWSVDGVRLYARRNGSNTGALKVGLYAADALGRPTGAALGTGSLDITTVGLTPGWVDIAVSGASSLDPSAAIVLVVGTADAAPGYVYYDTVSLDLSKLYSVSSNGGSSWSLPLSTSALEFTTYGSYK
ncbi:MAG: prepilin-type N-terminal cleavage/methylation domain-containing protein [Phycisphaerales bacterium]|nr:prepilin-type N-terminal cleavage/methylation domain-containing protein [Phycisphaerales bacterium]